MILLQNESVRVVITFLCIWIGDEENKGKQKKERNKKGNRERDLKPATVNHMVTFYHPHGSYGERIILEQKYESGCEWK